MRRILILITLLIVSLCGYFLYHDHLDSKKTDQKVFDKVMTEKMEILYVQAKNWKKPITLNVEDERLEGDYKIMSEFILTYWVNNIEARNSYLRQLDGAEWDQFLNIERLDQDRQQAYQQTKSMLIAVRKATSEFQQKNKAITEKAIADVENLEVSKKLKQAMSDKLKLTRDSSNELALLHIELEVLKRAEEMFEMLKSKKWIKQDNLILFEQDEDVRKFNVLYAEVNEFQSQIEELKRQNASVFESDEEASSPAVSDAQVASAAN